MDLSVIRKRIDEIDRELIERFTERMDISKDVARAKIEMGKRVYDPDRERSKLMNIANQTPVEYQPQVVALFKLLMSMSKAEQGKLIHAQAHDGVAEEARRYLQPADKPFPEIASVACQGVEGAYSQIAASKLFKVPGITYFESFEGVFKAVSEGLCEYGVVPIENSTAGSVNAVYDLLGEYRCSIVRALRLKIDHNLLVKPGTRLENISEVYSHEQALNQCEGFLEQMGVHAHICDNTAMAAQAVAESDRSDVAALSSLACASLYGLEVLQRDVQDSDNNYTRFVVISSKPQVFPGATRSSLMITVNHEPGALYRVLERFYALDINLVKLESRPVVGKDNEFMFYFDLDCPMGSQSLDTLLDSLDNVCASFTYFGSYTEVL